jgi:autotransporter-associated beta strand protein
MKAVNAAILGALLGAFTTTTFAQTSVWSGLSGSTANWTDGANWVGGVAPSVGNDLLFPAGASRKVNTNNFAAFTSFKRLVFDGGGYQLRGNNIRLTGETPEFPSPGDPPNIIEYTATATNAIFFDILVAESNKSAAIEAANKANSLLTLHGDINLIFNPVLVFESGVIDHRGAITGIGSVQVYPNARAVFNTTTTNNSYDGYTAVSGELELFKGTAIPGDLELSAPLFFPDPGAITWFADDQVYDFGRFVFYGTLNFPGTKDTIGDFMPALSVEILGNPGLSINGDLIPTGNPFAPDEPLKLTGSGAWLTFTTGDHTINQTGLVSGLWLDARVRGPGDITKIGTNVLYLPRSNDFSGVLTVLDGPVIVSNSWSLGATSAGTVIGAGGMLVLGAAGVPFVLTNEPITAMAGARISRQGASATTLTGPVSLPSPGPVVTVTNPSLSVNVRFEGAITGAGGLTINGNTMIYGTSHNTYAGATVVERGMLTIWKQAGKAMGGNLIVGDDNPLDDEEVALFFYGTNLLENTADVTVKAGARWRHDSATETFARLLGDGVVSNASGALIVGFGDAAFTFNGTLQGGGFFEKIGAGKGVLNGNGPFSGEITVNDGALEINGAIPAATTAVIPGSRLTGNGIVANLFVQNTAIYQPGRSKQDGLNVMTSSNLNLAAGAIFRVAIWGGGADQHGRASVKGIVNLTNAVLDVQLLAPPPVGAEYVLIENDGAEQVNGTFDGLPGGEFTGPGGLQWEIEYGNDVTLRLLSQGFDVLPPTLGGEDFADIIVQGGNGDAYVDPNECVQLYIPIYNEEPVTSEVVQVTLVSLFPDLVVHQPYSLYPEIPPGDSAYNITPFQVSVPKGFACGTNLPMALVVKQGTNAPYALAVGLPTGHPAAEPMRLDSAGPIAIPDESLLIDFVFVSDFTGHLAKVEASLHLNHPALDTLNVTLVGPGDIQIPLALGLSGSSYGNACADSNRTTFAAEADTFIGDGTAPYVGVFRPVGILPILRGMPESEVENRWYLWVEDTATGTTGTLECWSLFLYPAECEEGEGGCALCPEPIVDSVDLLELPGAGRLARFDTEAGPTACGDEPALDYFAAPGDFYYKTYSFYNQNEAETCVSVTLYTGCTGANAIVSSAHLGGYNPPLAWTNVLGYIGEEPGYDTSPRSYSFLVPGLSEITIVVSATASFTPCGGFTMQVTSPDLCPAELAIWPAGSDKVQLDWSTGAAGYLLQKNTSMLAPTNWVFVPDSPVVSGDRFVVTNEPIDPHAFFRLLKP